MGRRPKGIWVFNDSSDEYYSPGIDGRTVEYRHVLVDWLNRAGASLSADREAAERVGALVEKMNENTAEYLKAVDRWIAEGKPEAVPFCETFREIASAFDYELELDLSPRHGYKKWHLAFHCVTAPSGEAYEGWRFSDKKRPDPRLLHQRWPGVPRRFNPECQAVNAVIFITLDGSLGTMKRCQVENCRNWFLTKDDPRVSCCAHHNADDLRRKTPKRRAQLRAAAKRAREREETLLHNWWKERGGETVKPGRRRAKD